MRIKFIIIFFFMFSGMYFTYSSGSKDSLKIHPFIKSAKTCRDCHSNNNKNIVIDNPANICSVQCQTCHKDMKNHHAIDIKIIDKLPGNIILSRNNRIMCISCHNPAMKRFDQKSWKSESLFESVFSRKETYKTYFLVKRNNDGSLCKVCH